MTQKKPLKKPASDKRAIPPEHPVALEFSRASFELLQSFNRTLEQQNASLLSQTKALRTENEQLKAQVVTDPLTGVFSRRFIEAELEKMHIRAQRRGRNEGYAVIMVDVDKFKSVNDTLGHMAGDEALRHIGKVLNFSQRISDSIGRWGGEEFVVLLPGCADIMAAAKVAEKLRAKIEAYPCSLDSSHGVEKAQELKLTASFGVAVSDKSIQTPKEVFARADAAVYKAKGKMHGGHDDPDETDSRNRVCLFTPSGELKIMPREALSKAIAMTPAKRPHPAKRAARHYRR